MDDVQPLVSAVVPCFNQGRMLGDAIASLRAQTYRKVEVIVVDDGSTDDTSAVAAALGARCVRQRNAGVAAARNAGARAAGGALLLFLDADDMLAPGAIEAGVDCLRRQRDAAFVFGSPDVVGLDRRAPAQVENDHYRRLLESNFIWMPGLVLYRREALDQVGGFDERFGGAADWDLYLRIAARLPIAQCDGLRGTYRRHGGSMSNDALAMFVDVSAVLRAQRAAVRGNRRYRASRRRGLRAVRSTWGGWAVSEVSEHLARGRVAAAGHGLVQLLRADPPAALRAIAYGLRRGVARRLRPGP